MKRLAKRLMRFFFPIPQLVLDDIYSFCFKNVRCEQFRANMDLVIIAEKR
jgi:hypothetical protein